jgi:hypothetical protein
MRKRKSKRKRKIGKDMGRVDEWQVADFWVVGVRDCAGGWHRMPGGGGNEWE